MDNYMQNVTGVTTNKPVPADGDDMTWDESTLSRDTAFLSESALSKVWADDDDNAPLTYAALVATASLLPAAKQSAWTCCAGG